MMLRLSSLLLIFAFACTPDDDTGQTAQGIQRIPCQVTADCAARGGTCSGGQCVASNECTTDADCRGGDVCTADVNFGGLCGPAGAPPTPAPLPPEDCTDGSDDDGDGDADCSDTDCANDPSCQPPPPNEDCTNGVDDDGDGDVDCADLHCSRDPICAPPGCNGSNCPCDVLAQNCSMPDHRCYPGGPNAADGQCYPTGGKVLGDACIEPPVDTPDSCTAGLLCIYEAETDPTGICRSICATSADCAAGEACYALFPRPTDFGVCHPVPPEDCTNGSDDDGDGDTDCSDSDCAADPSCVPPPPPEDCANGIDDDGDGIIDCNDFDCTRDPACP